jgi:hypothetical protein
VADFNFKLGGTFFDFPESGEVTGEFGATVSYSVANYVDLELAWWSDVKGGGAPGDELQLGHYIEFSVGKSFALKDWLGLEMGAGISCGIDYYGVDGLNHAFGKIGFPQAPQSILLAARWPSAKAFASSHDPILGSRS